jgi:tRNA (uracil-5-)-methyltransferase TRM9
MTSVKEVYNKISNDFDITRFRVWTCTSDFLDLIGKDTYGLEVGCGNGKNMVYCNELKKNIKIKGIDISDKFVEICQKKNLDVEQGDMIKLPYLDESFDFVYSIAVLHHLDKEEERVNALKEMFRVCKKDGLIFVLVWAFDQEPDSKRKFSKTDELVSWKSRQDGKTYFRYYHLYLKGELEKEFSKTNFKYNIIKNFYEKGNWGFIGQKK